MAKLFSKLVNPWYPATAIGFESGFASMVQLERARRGACTVKRAATVDLPESMIRPRFDQVNIENGPALAGALRDLAASAGLLQQKRWSMTLPDAVSRAAIVTLDSRPASSSELEEVLRWKIERSFGIPFEELKVARQRLPATASSPDRFLIVASSAAVLREYENVIASLGWRAGLILPRHAGEGQWLTQNGSSGDALLVSSATGGFTAVVYRDKQPLLIRTVSCDSEECEDELYRLLLYYSERRAGESANQANTINRLLMIGDLLDKRRASEILNETLGSDLRPLAPEDLGLQMATRELSFDLIAAPAGLATLSWQ